MPGIEKHVSQNFACEFCRWCHKKYSYPISNQEAANFFRYLTEPDFKMLIQDILPSVSDDDREIFISQYCSKCFDMVFGKGQTLQYRADCDFVCVKW